MSSIRSQAAIRFIAALFLAQAVNAAAVPHPHVHRVTDAHQVVSLPLVERQEPVEDEPQNVFDALVSTLEGYNGWEVFSDFFEKLFSGEDTDDNDEPSIIVMPTLDANVPADVVSAIASVVSEIAAITEPIVVISPAPTDEPAATTDDEMMSILPIFPITTAIELFPTEEPSLPSELMSEMLPEPTDIPVVVVIPPAGSNSTDAVVIALPTGILPPLMTGPIEVVPAATGAPFPVANGTIVAPLPGTDVPVVIIMPTGISSPIGINASVSVEANATISLTSTVELTVTVEPTLIGTGVASVGTGLPVTFVETISAPFANDTSDIATAVLPIGTAVVAIGTAVTPIATVVAPIGTAIVGTGTDGATAVLAIGTDLPMFPNATAVETVVEIAVEPTFVLGTGTAPAVGTISAAPIPTDASDAFYTNTTTTTTTQTITPVILETAVAPVGTMIPEPEQSGTILPDIIVNVNVTLPVSPSVAVDLPMETSDAVIPVESLGPIPTDAPVVEFPGQPILPIPTLPITEEPTLLSISPVVSVVAVEASAAVEASVTAEATPVVVVAPAEETPAVVVVAPAEETPAVVVAPAEETPVVVAPAEETPVVVVAPAEETPILPQ